MNGLPAQPLITDQPSRKSRQSQPEGAEARGEQMEGERDGGRAEETPTCTCTWTQCLSVGEHKNTQGYMSTHTHTHRYFSLTWAVEIHLPRWSAPTLNLPPAHTALPHTTLSSAVHHLHKSTESPTVLPVASLTFMEMSAM